MLSHLPSGPRNPQNVPAIRTLGLINSDHKAAVWTGSRLGLAQGSSTGDAGRLAHRIRDPAVFASHAGKSLRKLLARALCPRSGVDDLPHPFPELKVLYILGDIVQTPQQRPRIHESRERRAAQGRRCPKPLLLPKLDQDAVLHPVNGDCQCGRAAGARAHTSPNLDCKAIRTADHLGPEAAAIEFGYQRLRQISWADVSVEKSLFHGLDYNLGPRLIYSMTYEFRTSWFRWMRWLPVCVLLLGLVWLRPQGANAQALPTSTETATPGGPAPIVTNNYTEAVHVRSGPNSLYSQVGDFPVGATAQALAVSPQHEWIQIAFPSAPGGVGWVYAPFVELSPGYLRVVEPPPTPTPLAPATIDATLAAAFQIEATVTRLPTFTPPPPLAIPTFSAQGHTAAGIPAAVTIAAITLVGGLVLAASFLGRR